MRSTALVTRSKRNRPRFSLAVAIDRHDCLALTGSRDVGDCAVASSRENRRAAVTHEHVVEHGERFASCLEPDRIEGNGEQPPEALAAVGGDLLRVDQKARLDEYRTGGAADDCSSFPGFQRDDTDVESNILAGDRRVERSVGTRQDFRQPKRALRARRSRRRHDFRLAPIRANAPETGAREENGSVLAPGPVADRAFDVAERHWRAAGERDFLQPLLHEESDPSAIGREERPVGALGAWNRRRLGTVKRADPELRRSTGARTDGAMRRPSGEIARFRPTG